MEIFSTNNQENKINCSESEKVNKKTKKILHTELTEWEEWEINCKETLKEEEMKKEEMVFC